MIGLICALNVVLHWDRTTFSETFQIENIDLEAPEESPSFIDWEQTNYGPKLRMKLSAYKEEIRSIQASFRRIERFNTCIPFMLGSQFSCLANPNT